MAPSYTLSADIIFSESLVPRPSTMMSKPVALGSSVPQWPTFLIWKRRRMASTTSCDVGPTGLSIRSAPSSGSNSCMALLRGVESSFDCGDDPPLNRQRSAPEARPGRGRVSAAAELTGDFIHIDALALRAQTDASEFRFELFEDAGHHDRFHGADMVNQTLRVGGVRAGAREVGFFEPEPGDLVVVGEPEMIVNVFDQADAREGIGLVDLVANPGQVRAAFDEFGRDVVGGGTGGGILKR